jgi:dihydrofolate reductase
VAIEPGRHEPHITDARSTVSKVVFDISMSVDGFVTAKGITSDEPMGAGGDRLHAWAFAEGSPRNRELLRASVATSGAFICGRRTYDLSLRWWKADGPTGPARLPLMVVTHQVPHHVPDDGVYRFVTTGVNDAVSAAREVAAGRAVAIMSADIGRQALRAGLVDEVAIHLVPVLLGGGTRLFDDPTGLPVDLGAPDVLETPEATHLTYRVDRRA